MQQTLRTMHVGTVPRRLPARQVRALGVNCGKRSSLSFFAASRPALRQAGVLPPMWTLQRRCTITRAVEEDVDVIDVEGQEIDTRIPVTVITGFLGSGKTTLLNNILTKDHGQRIAVIENEFGEIDIDSSLVAVEEDLDPEAESIMTLNNGCLCCTVRDDLIETLNKLYDRRDKFDRVLIETTGLANPAPIIQTFFLDETVAEKMKVDGVVTVVDAKHVELRLDEKKPDGVVNEALEQIAFADRIVLNKTDLVTERDLERIEDRIRGINSLAHVKRTQKAAVPVEYVLGVGGFDLEKVEEEVMGPARAEEHHHHDHDHECGPGCTHESHSHSHDEGEGHSHAAHASHDHDHEHSHGHSHDHEHSHECGPGCTDPTHNHSHAAHAKHDDAVSSVSVELEGDLDLDKVNYWLGAMIEIKSADLYRMKGVLAIKDFDRRFVFQGVHQIFNGMPDRLWKEGEKKTSRMVFIGKDLDREVIEEGFRKCVVGK